MPSLTDMPDLVMNNILEKVDLKAILNLQKVCHDLRNFIDDVTPDAHLTEIEIHICSKSIKVIYRSKTDRYEMNYENFPEQFSKDFEIISKFVTKSVLKEFQICWRYAYKEEFENCLKMMRNVLKLRPQKLKVEEFSIEAFDQDQILMVLPFLDPLPLYSIDIREPCVPDYSVFRVPMKIDMLLDLEQWKEAQDLLMSRKIDILEIGNFLTFSVVFLEIKTITKKVLEEIKETFLNTNSCDLVEFDIEYDEFPDEAAFFEPFGAPFLEYDPDPMYKNWYFKIPGSPHFLDILQWFEGPVKHIKFSIIKKCNVAKIVRDRNGW